MIRVRLAAAFIAWTVLTAAWAATLFAVRTCAGASEIPTTSSVDAYRAHLGQLLVIVADCQRQHTGAACDPSRVGPDDKITLAADKRTSERNVRYDWLRALLAQAGDKSDQPIVPSIAGASITPRKSQPIEVQLQQAQERLIADAKQLDGEQGAGRIYHSERQALTSILAGKDYKLATQTTLRERFIAWILNWVDRILDRLVSAGMHFPWLARALRALFVGAISLILVWLFVRLDRRSRIQMIPDTSPGRNSPSTREWQLWFEDARKMAEQGSWRDAIHFLYWAVISRLESRHVWPADSARTPREYLRLVPNGDPRREKLRLLTGSFESTWYGGRNANFSEFNRAVRIAEELGVK